ncbi:GNAT family N-acetyltransferase [Nocardiopsis tropica]|uniref:GNAT family N-acetyltransferase n=1 Tax=Nocardiopsis tropica TaxID=109330 RepID=A0ABU7KWJ9_9ACTN|nr:GNAT family N-acetyltransferase [Nocardiopsis umidischolae]MEE2053685.1 GNAT family N-acetyltransferase [Nocardiopsis umidischolae]
MTVEHIWRGAFDNTEVDALHARGFGYEPGDAADVWGRVNDHSLGWVCARRGDELVGFVNVVWDGGVHAFVLDTVTDPRLRRAGIGAGLVRLATERARDAGCRWLHVDFEPHLEPFYLRACGFSPTRAGLIAL